MRAVNDMGSQPWVNMVLKRHEATPFLMSIGRLWFGAGPSRPSTYLQLSF